MAVLGEQDAGPVVRQSMGTLGPASFSPPVWNTLHPRQLGPTNLLCELHTLWLLQPHPVCSFERVTVEGEAEFFCRLVHP